MKLSTAFLATVYAEDYSQNPGLAANHNPLTWQWPWANATDAETWQWIPSQAGVGAERECCEHYDVTVPSIPAMNGRYTRQTKQSWGEWIWHQHDASKPKYNMGAKQCNGKYYWGFSESTYTSNGSSSKVKIRAWDKQFKEVCVEDTSGWKIVGGSSAPDIVVSCAGGQTTQLPTTNKPTTQPTTKKPTTKQPTTQAPTTEKTKPKTTTQPWGKDKCVDPDELNMKVVKDTKPTDGFNNNSKASLQCKVGYQLNLPKKIKVAGTCLCLYNEDIDDFKCNWHFSKGDVQCVSCPKPLLAGKNGLGVLATAQWETGIALYFRIKPWAASSDGWHVALQFDTPLEGITSDEPQLYEPYFHANSLSTADYSLNPAYSHDPLFWQWPDWNFTEAEEHQDIPAPSVGASRPCCEKYRVTVDEDASLNGLYTRQKQMSFGEYVWHLEDKDKAAVKLGACRCGNDYYWGFSKCSYTSSSSSCSVYHRGWGEQGYPKFADECADLTSGWKFKSGGLAPGTKITCADEGATTKAPTTKATTRNPTTQGPNPTTQGPNPTPSPTGAVVKPGGLDITGVSRDRSMWTFSPRAGPDMDIGALKGKKYPLMIMFDNLTPEEIESVKTPKILYYKKWSTDTDGDLSCELDRFEDYPV